MLLLYDDLIARHGPDRTLQSLMDAMVCTRCGGKGGDLRISVRKNREIGCGNGGFHGQAPPAQE